MSELNKILTHIDLRVGANERIVNNLAKNYSTLDYYVTLIKHLNNIYPLGQLENFSKYDLHKLLNEVLILYYNGEEILKYKLAKMYLTKRSIVGGFEMKVNNSRVDFLAINGVSTSYEIKSELDNLSKLNKQMSDYMLVFEYNYLIIDQIHLEKAKDLLPPGFGLWCYKNGKYRTLQKANLNTKIDPEMQLSLLTKKELSVYYPDTEGNIKKILSTYNANNINDLFKKTLKNRYRDRWKFLISHKENIFPIDIQFFFNTNIPPDHIYRY